jgi:Ser/Thr protein kinase RdoA (MazF antagonist)
VRDWDRGNNNTLWRVGEAYVLRRYDTFEPTRVALEHRLLAALAERELPFDVPAPLPTIAGELTVGPFALYPLLAGQMADQGQLDLVAEALGVLDLAMADLPPSLAPYEWRPETIHPAVPDVADLADQLRRALPGHPGVSWFCSIDPKFDESALPTQIVHGDWDLSNVLIDNGIVTAALDFENAGLAARIRDVAASFYSCVTYINAQQVATFCHAYLDRVDLTDDEREAFPDELRLRAYAQCVWRSGRWRRGQNTLDSIADALSSARRLDQWLATTTNPMRPR